MTPDRLGHADDWQGRQLPAGFYYHGTRPSNVASIARDGLHPARSRSSLPSIFFDRWDHQAFSTDHGLALLRVSAEDIPSRPGMRPGPRQMGGGWIAESAIEPRRIEVYGADGEWHRLGS